MSISAKKRRAILNAVSEAFRKVINEQHPDLNDPPDTWDSEKTALFDALSYMEMYATENINKALDEKRPS